MRIGARLAVVPLLMNFACAQAADVFRLKCDIAAVEVKNLRVPIGYRTTAAIEIDPSAGRWTLAWFDETGNAIGTEDGALTSAGDKLFTLKDAADKTPSGEGHTLETVDRSSGAFVRDSRGKNFGVDVVLKQEGTCKAVP